MHEGLNKTFDSYLGDSVYVTFDGFHIVLTTDNGYGASNTIYLDPTVSRKLKAYIENLPELIEVFKRSSENVPRN